MRATGQGKGVEIGREGQRHTTHGMGMTGVSSVVWKFKRRTLPRATELSEQAAETAFADQVVQLAFLEEQTHGAAPQS